MTPTPGDATVVSFGVWCWMRVFATEVLGHDLAKTRFGEAAFILGVVLAWNIARRTMA